MSEENKKNIAVVENESNVTEISVKKRVEQLPRSSNEFNLFQELLQEVQATDISESIESESNVPLSKQINKLREVINQKFANEDTVRNLLLEYFPAESTIYNWVATDKWKNAVVTKVKSSFNFNEKRRARVFDAIYTKATQQRDMKAAELFCKLSGDIQSTSTATKDTSGKDTLEGFNKILHGKK